jgi:hypothetical protein
VEKRYRETERNIYIYACRHSREKAYTHIHNFTQKNTQPTDLTHTVLRCAPVPPPFVAGITTVSTINPSCNLTNNLTVPQLLFLRSTTCQ